jgi:DNA-binding SARP family transcriptional activator
MGHRRARTAPGPFFESRIKLLLDRLVDAQRWEAVLEWGERWIALAGAAEAAYRALMIANAG